MVDSRFRVGQGSWVYSIQGSHKLGTQYLPAEIWTFGISFVLLTTNFGCKVYYVPFNFGYIGEIWGILGTFFRIYPLPHPGRLCKMASVWSHDLISASCNIVNS